MKSLSRISALLVFLFAVTFVTPSFGQGFSINISVDEDCHGFFTNTSGFYSSLNCGVVADAGPGGLPAVLTYDLLNPPGLTPGDLLLLDPGTNMLSDVVRFNPTGAPANPNGGSLAFYSISLDGFDSQADTLAPPSALYPNQLSLTESRIGTNVGIIYTPTAGQPGFVTGAGGPATYTIISDTPEPSTLVFVACGGVLLLWRRRHTAA
jgi:hypothetical protein